MSVWGITVLFFCLFVCDFCWDSDRIVPRSVTELCQWKMSDSGPMWSSCGRKLQRKSMSVCGRHWATSAHHAQLWRSGVQSFSKEIWRWKMRDDLDLYQSPPEIVDHVYDLILAKTIAEMLETSRQCLAYTSWALGKQKLLIKLMLKCLNADEIWN